jgi:hypothetical protein
MNFIEIRGEVSEIKYGGQTETEKRRNHHHHAFNLFIYTKVYPKVYGLSHNEINNNNKHSLRTNTKDYGGITH